MLSLLNVEPAARDLEGVGAAGAGYPVETSGLLGRDRAVEREAGVLGAVVDDLLVLAFLPDLGRVGAGDALGLVA